MSCVLIIGAGGVGKVVCHKCAQVPEVFTEIYLASRTLSKCKSIAAEIEREIKTEQINADDTKALVELIKKVKPDLVINVALPYQDLSIMQACLQTGVHYLDTANYESPELAKFEYKEQWALHNEFKKANLMALLGSGFDPGVTNVFTAWIKKKHLDEIHELDIIDCNAGDHGLPFATNFNPEINIREVTAKGRYYDNGRWIETEPLSLNKSHNFPDGIGPKNIYLMYHEELESLTKFFPEIRQARFWMTFSDNYLKYLDVLENIGITSIEPIEYQGQKIVPLQFLKALLPNPATLASHTKGKTWIGCTAKGISNGKEKTVTVYNICHHEAAYKEVNSQAISYTTGVPTMIGAMMILTKTWEGKGVFNMEQFDPEPFMEKLMQHGLPWKEIIS